MTLSRQLLILLSAMLLAACATTAPPPEERLPEDPWEPFNRSMYSVNRAADRAVLRPVARGYTAVTPEPAQRGVRNFFRNLSAPVIMMNLALQGRGSDLEDEFQRFVTNTIYGVGGLFDVASAGGIERHDADFGQTLARYGWTDSRFLMLPFLGPSTVRDATGRVADSPADIAWRRVYQEGNWGLLALRLVEIRAALLPLDAELEQATDEYILVRDAWLQRRNFFIFGGEVDTPDYDAFLDDDWDDWDD